MKTIRYRLGLEQRLFPEYRRPFFELLAGNCPKGFCLFAGKVQPGEGVLEAATLQKGEWVRAENRYVFSGKTLLYHEENLLAWLESWKPQVLIVEANLRHLGLRRAIRWMHQHGGRVIGWGLGFGGNKTAFSITWQGIQKAFIQNFDVLLSYSQKGKNEYVEAGFPAERVFVASNAVSPQPKWKIPHRGKDLKRDKPTVLFVGRLLERKSVDRLIQACARISGKFQPDLVIVGEGPERTTLEKLAFRIYPDTRFAGDLRGRKLEDAYRQADLFVLPGTGGLAIQQAMSYGLPVITGVGDGTQSDLVRSENGWQLVSDKAEELTDKLTSALKDPAKLRKMGEASFKIVKNEVNLESMLESFANAVEYAMKMDERK